MKTFFKDKKYLYVIRDGLLEMKCPFKNREKKVWNHLKYALH